MTPRTVLATTVCIVLVLAGGCVEAVQEEVSRLQPQARDASNGTDDADTTPRPSVNRSSEANDDRERRNATDADPGDANETSRTGQGDPGGAAGPWAGDPRVTGVQPIGLFPSLVSTTIEVLLVPPAHGDLGEPGNDSRRSTDYLDATVDAIRDWDAAIDRYVETHPSASHLAQIDIHLTVYDGTPEVVGYDVVVAYVETAGPVFRGVAATGDPTIERHLADLGLANTVHASTRVVLLSLFASAPRANQTIPDYPETREVHDVTLHEFGHALGVGHTDTWTARHGPDLMNSPYPFVYGDGDPLGDGGERSPNTCISTLDLHALAQVYAWLGGDYQGASGNQTLPTDLDYALACVPGTSGLETHAPPPPPGLVLP